MIKNLKNIVYKPPDYWVDIVSHCWQGIQKKKGDQQNETICCRGKRYPLFSHKLPCC